MRARSSGSDDIRNIGLASLGAALEYYDFIVYAFVAAALGQAFFPPETSDLLKQVQVFSIYAVGYFIRPVAGLVIAHFADKLGRKKLFIFTVLMMSIPTLLIGVLPTYSQVGWLAPVFLLLLRVGQGCAVGGELPGAAVFVAEHAPPGRLLFSSGCLHGIVHLGLVLGAGMSILAALIAGTDPRLSSLAWRLPFLIGGVSGLIAAYLRRHLEETPQFLAIRKQRGISQRVPLAAVARTHWRACLVGLGLGFYQVLAAAVFTQYMQTYLIAAVHLPGAVVSTANLVGIVVFALSMPAWGWVADRVGAFRIVVLTACISLASAAYFFSHLPGPGDDGGLLWLFVPVALTAGAVTALIPGLLASLFPTEIRQSGYALPYNVGAAVFAGPALLVLAAAVRGYGIWAALAIYAAGCAVAIAAAVALRSQPRFLGAGSAAPGGASQPAMQASQAPTA